MTGMDKGRHVAKNNDLKSKAIIDQLLQTIKWNQNDLVTQRATTACNANQK